MSANNFSVLLIESEMARNRLATSLDFETNQHRAVCHLQTWGPALTSAPSLPTVKCRLSVAVLGNISPPCHVLKQGRRKQLKSGGPSAKGAMIEAPYIVAEGCGLGRGCATSRKLF